MVTPTRDKKKKVNGKRRGPPEKYTDDEVLSRVIPEYIRLCKQGYSDVAICATLDVSHDYILERGKRHEALAEAIKKGRGWREKYWTDIGKAGMTGTLKIKDADGKEIAVKAFNPTLFIWMTRNLCKWRNDDPRDFEEGEGQRGSSSEHSAPKTIKWKIMKDPNAKRTGSYDDKPE